MNDADNLYGISCLNCHGGGYVEEFLDRGTPTTFTTGGNEFGGIHGVDNTWAPTWYGHEPKAFTYGAALGNIDDWTNLGSPSCGAVSDPTMLSDCTNHSPNRKSYTRSYSREFRPD